MAINTFGTKLNNSNLHNFLAKCDRFELTGCLGAQIVKILLIWLTPSKVIGGGGTPHGILLFCKSVCNANLAFSRLYSRYED